MKIVENEGPEEFAQEEVDAAVEDHEAAEDRGEENKPNNNWLWL